MEPYTQSGAVYFQKGFGIDNVVISHGKRVVNWQPSRCKKRNAVKRGDKKRQELAAKVLDEVKRDDTESHNRRVKRTDRELLKRKQRRRG